MQGSPMLHGLGNHGFGAADMKVLFTQEWMVEVPPSNIASPEVHRQEELSSEIFLDVYPIVF